MKVNSAKVLKTVKISKTVYIVYLFWETYNICKMLYDAINQINI